MRSASSKSGPDDVIYRSSSVVSLMGRAVPKRLVCLVHVSWAVKKKSKEILLGKATVGWDSCGEGEMN